MQLLVDEKSKLIYRRHEVQDRLQLLRFSMLRKEKASPKLRASAAEARALIPFALELANEVLDDANPFHAAMKSAAYHLLQCYKSLSKEIIFGKMFCEPPQGNLRLST